MDDRELLSVICPVLGDEACSDDCAILPVMKGTPVVSTDMLHETTDFPAGISDWQIGWMAMAVTISDIASMGAAPRYLTLAIGLDREDRLEEIVHGAQACCQKYGARYIGGDLDAHTELTLVSTGIGEVEDGRPVRRSGAMPGDLIGVTGVQGRAIAGLKGDRQYWRDLCEPAPRVKEGISIRLAGATAMMDISDGLAISIHDLMKASGTGCKVSSSEIPCIPNYPPEESLRMALYGGGDFELLFTIPPKSRKELPASAVLIGRVTEKQEILLDGSLLPAEGYRHHW
ncbi:thiamine-phosphate kinase [uncultured Methanospirillum sp.]|uniref:thiamine-phosphate kinase n=1 Tax=uncultured Methanospirillum sp. TaxID=262503 RepID=UPI0029C77AEB|nr:thiamine-phosphate kinase [uncultured Methanospirillum sp.]